MPAFKTPKDLEGKCVGVRAYSVITGVWTRQVLIDKYVLDSSKVTWVVDDEEHVTQLKLPANVIHAPAGSSLAEMMAKGELSAGFAAAAGDLLAQGLIDELYLLMGSVVLGDGV